MTEKSEEPAEPKFPRFDVHFDRADPSQNTIKLNGELMGGVTKFSVSIDAETNMPKVVMELIPLYVNATITGATLVQSRPIVKDGKHLESKP